MCTRTLHDDMPGLYLDRAFHLRTEGGREGPLFLEVRVLCHRHFPGGTRVLSLVVFGLCFISSCLSPACPLPETRHPAAPSAKAPLRSYRAFRSAQARRACQAKRD